MGREELVLGKEHLAFPRYHKMGPGVGLVELMMPLGHGQLNKSNNGDHDQL